MKIEIRNGKAHISGYVNAVGRDSKTICSPSGDFVEMIEPGAFAEALSRAKNVDMLLNHDENRQLASTSGGNLTLKEDNIGLHADCEVSDPEVVEKAKRNELQGWSFGFYVGDSSFEPRINDIPRRHVKSLDIFEVSILDNRMSPAYAGTSVECRADKSVLAETRANEDPAEVTEIKETKQDAKQEEWQKRINELNIKSMQDKVDALKKGAIA